MAEGARLFARHWRIVGIKRALANRGGQERLRQELVINNGTPQTAPKPRTFSTAQSELGGFKQERESGVTVNSSTSEENNNLFLPFKSGEDPAGYPEGSFQELFEKSKFVKALDPVGKEVEADVIAVVEDQLYVDFGCKFHAVVPCPDSVKGKVHRGAKVIVIVKDLEVTRAFIGASKHDSLLEATAEFIRLQV